VQRRAGAHLAAAPGAVHQRRDCWDWRAAPQLWGYEMTMIRLLILALCAGLSTPSFAATFSNNWSFVDSATGQTVGGIISGLTDGNDLTAEGLIITVTQSPYATFLGSYELDFGAATGDLSIPDTYSASNGVVTFANFLYANEMGEFLQFGTHPGAGSRYPQLNSYNTGEWAYNQQTGIQFSAISTAVPEPASWALMIGGFCLIGTTMRGRRVMMRFA
jgi:hypothetical protein